MGHGNSEHVNTPGAAWLQLQVRVSANLGWAGREMPILIRYSLLVAYLQVGLLKYGR